MFQNEHKHSQTYETLENEHYSDYLCNLVDEILGKLRQDLALILNQYYSQTKKNLLG